MIKKKLVKKGGGGNGYFNVELEPKNFARATVKRWLKNNASRFLSHPRITSKWKNGFHLKFTGISPRLVVNINNGGAFEVCVLDEEGNCWDIITDFDVYTKRDDTGRYYCALCIEGYSEFYPTMRELWEKHSLEPLLAWANENLHAEQWIFLYKTTGGTRWAELNEADKLTACRKDENFYAAFPVSIPQTMPIFINFDK